MFASAAVGEPPFLLVGLILGAVAIGLLALGGYAIRVDRRLARRLRQVEGRVAGTNSFEFDGLTRYECVVEFVPEENARAMPPVRVTRSAMYGAPTWTIGQACRVRYDPLDPTIALVDDDKSGHGTFGWPFFGVGVLVSLIASFLIAAHVLGPAHPFIRFGSQFFGGD